MRFVGIVGMVVGLVVSGCATVGGPISDAKVGPLATAGSQVSFDYNCPEERIRLIRTDNTTIDLDICGVVRRYKSVASGIGGAPAYTWLDVTNSYPASALPSPLPPAKGK
jgi:hypothetical protein